MPTLTQPLYRTASSPVRQFYQSSILLNSINKLEEEVLPWYSQDRVFPVKIGDVFRSRCQVIGKVGYGAYSTVWLCRDLRSTITSGSPKSSHAGAILVRTALDGFQIKSAHGSYSYQCLIHPPLATSLFELQNQAKAKVLPDVLLKPTLIHILLLSFDFLHTEAHVIHTDIQEKNIMLGVEGELILVDFEEVEKSNLKSMENCGRSGGLLFSKARDPKVDCRPILSDFGEARFGSSSGTKSEDVQPSIYQAPEVLLQMTWNPKNNSISGIWESWPWDLFEQGHLIYARDSNKNDSDGHHLAEMIALLGLPPNEMLRNSEYANELFDSDGNWRGFTEIPSMPLEKLKVCKAQSKSAFFALCAKCFDSDQESEPRRRGCYQILS
ncbi:kinase-like domain-containing protein [Aspergillus alliaceus]|uniref:non-specific serine/threonine protein kinase n=1 Tax=Petromyces alliaceus TaxID=209559 RepID=A0A5N7C095_PETAA|nr:kinase-like domain-containing protein [Aspergillus alliaceus]